MEWTITSMRNKLAKQLKEWFYLTMDVLWLSIVIGVGVGIGFMGVLAIALR